MDMKFSQRLRQGDYLVGTMLTLPAPEIAEMVAKCGFDWLFMDGEHGALSTLDWQRMLQAVAGRSASIIRVAENSEATIKKALDLGADGIIAPQVNSADEARRIVSYCKYPPQGVRGVGLARAQGYGLDFASYVESANDDVAVIIQAEHIDAIGNIEEIATVKGIDAVFIGPYDLSASMGKMGQIDDAEVVAAIDSVTRACQLNNVALGYFGVDAQSVQPYIEKGYKLICAGLDAGFVTAGAQQIRAQLTP
ncbi:MAG: 2,4-dihydroxyhept-2-ene-1,7-dioic acid aldolase [Gammaproteobacteria bacterium]|nr:2,4-dihydroxyhept-2-ene-1,7-dioic acid aldolase [Gammaproteobacteria bacterium]